MNSPARTELHQNPPPSMPLDSAGKTQRFGSFLQRFGGPWPLFMSLWCPSGIFTDLHTHGFGQINIELLLFPNWMAGSRTMPSKRAV